MTLAPWIESSGTHEARAAACGCSRHGAMARMRRTTASSTGTLCFFDSGVASATAACAGPRDLLRDAAPRSTARQRGRAWASVRPTRRSTLADATVVDVGGRDVADGQSAVAPVCLCALRTRAPARDDHGGQIRPVRPPRRAHAMRREAAGTPRAEPSVAPCSGQPMLAPRAVRRWQASRRTIADSTLSKIAWH